MRQLGAFGTDPVSGLLVGVLKIDVHNPFASLSGDVF